MPGAFDFPARFWTKYEWRESLVLKETKDGVLVSGTKINELSWKETVPRHGLSSNEEVERSRRDERGRY